MLFSKRAAFSAYQIINQYILLMLLTGIFVCVASVSSKLDKLPDFIKKVINYLAKITLEVYVVQVVIIERFRGLKFPINWIVITAIVIIGASLLHFVIQSPYLIKRIKKRKEV